ncbi:transporter [Rhizoctonia solani]|uniref:Transporter n=1 Tax=Rhizoctonia solani TaxID=456999 RepID=A0A8H7IIR1_9AGAM|nr:transporter [Rhizoctonia solani]
MLRPDRALPRLDYDVQQVALVPSAGSDIYQSLHYRNHIWIRRLALKPALIRKGVYSWLCSHDESNPASSCNEQELRLNNMFVVSVALTNVRTIAQRLSSAKYELDGIVTRWIVFGNGYIRWPFVLDGYYAGFFLLAIGSPLIFLSSFHISNAFPARSGLILSFIMAAFNASSTAFVLFDWVDKKSGNMSIQAWFWCYALIPALFIVLQSLTGPPNAYQKQMVSQENQLSDNPASAVTYGTISTGEPSSEQPRHPDPKDTFVGIMSGRPFIVQLFSRHFGLLLLFFSVYADRVNWEIQTISEQFLFYLANPNDALRMSSLFSILLPLGGIIGIPLFGWLLDQRTTLDASVAILIIGVSYGGLGMTSLVATQIVSISLFVVLRPLLYIFGEILLDYFEAIGVIDLSFIVGDYCGKIGDYSRWVIQFDTRPNRQFGQESTAWKLQPNQQRMVDFRVP